MKLIKKIYTHKYLHLALLIAILTLALFLRFYNFTNRYSLGSETVRDAFVGIIGAQQLQLPLVGPFSSFGQFTFGPWYWWELIFFTLIAKTVFSPWIIL